MVLHGSAWYCTILHYLSLSCTILELSLSLLVTTLWTLWASTYGPLQTSEGILAQLMMSLYTYYKFASTQPPSDSLSPLSPYQPPRALVPYGYLRPIFGISLAYIDHIFAIYIGPVTFSEHFQHSPTTSWPQCTCTTIPKQYCEVKSIRAFTPLPPLLYNYSSSPTPPLHWSDFTLS